MKYNIMLYYNRFYYILLYYTIIYIYIMHPLEKSDQSLGVFQEVPTLRKGGSAPKGGAHSTVFFAHTQPARLCKTCFFCQIIRSWFGSPPQKWFLGAGFLGAPPLSPSEARVRISRARTSSGF